MKKMFTILAMLFVFLSNAQSVYMKNFGTSYSSWAFSAGFPGSVTDNGGTTTRSCTFADGPTAMPNFARYTKTNIYDPLAMNYHYNWDSIVVQFRYRTTGYAKNFRVIFDWLVGAGSTYEYDLQTNYLQPDTQDVKIFGYGPSGNPLNCEIGLIKTDTTLNDFTVFLSNLSMKGYITYTPVGLSEQTSSKDAIIMYNSETLFFPEKWLNKKYWITDILGKEYVSGIVSSSEEKVDLENGLYILRTEKSIQKILIAH